MQGNETNKPEDGITFKGTLGNCKISKRTHVQTFIFMM